MSQMIYKLWLPAFYAMPNATGKRECNEVNDYFHKTLKPFAFKSFKIEKNGILKYPKRTLSLDSFETALELEQFRT